MLQAAASASLNRGEGGRGRSAARPRQRCGESARLAQEPQRSERGPWITDDQYAAGERLRADYWFAHLSPRVTSNWSALAPTERSRRGAPSNAAALRDEVLAAKERVMRALMAVGPEVSGVLVDICCELKGLEDAEKENGWPQRAGKVVLQIALTRLAKHYGLDRRGEADAGEARIAPLGKRGLSAYARCLAVRRALERGVVSDRSIL
ncbi:MAG: DUF6456 domain-containing protein [Methyloceanibacter sp.]